MDKTRRQLLAALGTSSIVPLAGCSDGGDEDADSDDSSMGQRGEDNNGNESVESENGNSGDNGDTQNNDEGEDEDNDENDTQDTVTVGVSIPLDGPLVGKDLEDGYRLAAAHINEGTGATTVSPWNDIDQGILGRELQLEFQNSQFTRSGARQTAEAFLEDGVAAITGGGSAQEGLGHQEAVLGEGTVYMGAFTPLDSLWGPQNCGENIFNEMYTPQEAAIAIRELLADQIDDTTGVTFAQLYSDNNFGNEMESRMQQELQSISNGWLQTRSVATPPYDNIKKPLERILAVSPDLVVLNFTGGAAGYALRELRQLDNSIDVVVPIIDSAMVLTSRYLDNVIGTTLWHPQFDDQFSEAFVNSWGEGVQTNRDQPSDLAFLAYVQLCQYVAAVERADSTDNQEVISELDGHNYAFGSRERELRACSSSNSRSIPVVSGVSGGGRSLQQERLVSVDEYNNSNGSERSDSNELPLFPKYRLEGTYFGSEDSGRGNQRTGDIILGVDSLFGMYFEHYGNSDFVVELIDADTGQSTETLINKTGNVSDVLAFPSRRSTLPSRPYTGAIDIQAGGAWTWIITLPSRGPDDRVPPFEATSYGTDLTSTAELDGGETINVSHRGESGFIVEFIKDDAQSVEGSELLFDETGSYRGETSISSSGRGSFYVRADGIWTLEVN